MRNKNVYQQLYKKDKKVNKIKKKYLVFLGNSSKMVYEKRKSGWRKGRCVKLTPLFYYFRII
jgi:hypothetical protein